MHAPNKSIQQPRCLLGNLPLELISPLLLFERQQDLCNILGSVTTKTAGLSALFHVLT